MILFVLVAILSSNPSFARIDEPSKVGTCLGACGEDIDRYPSRTTPKDCVEGEALSVCIDRLCKEIKRTTVQTIDEFTKECHAYDGNACRAIMDGVERDGTCAGEVLPRLFPSPNGCKVIHISGDYYIVNYREVCDRGCVIK